MDPSLLIQLALGGLVAGSVFALVALGFGIIYGASGHFHIAHIATVTVSGYFGALFSDRLSAPFWLALPCTVLAGGLFGAAVYRLLYAPLERRGAERIMVFIVSLALVILSENLLLWIFGATPQRVVAPVFRDRVELFGWSLNIQQLLLIVLALLAFAGIVATIRWTHAGLLMRAVSTNPRLLRAIARQPKTIITLAYFAGSAVTSIAGFSLAADAGVVPLRGHEFFLPAAMAVILGGVGSFAGAFWVAMGAGVLMNVSSMWISHGWSLGLIFAVFVVGIVFRPEGVFAPSGKSAKEVSKA